MKIFICFCLGLLMCSCKTSSIQKVDSKIILTKDGLSKKYADAFKCFRERKNERSKYVKEVENFLLYFTLADGRDKNALLKNPFFMTVAGIKELMGKPDKMDGEFLYYKVPPSKYLIVETTTQGFLYDLSWSHVIK